MFSWGIKAGLQQSDFGFTENKIVNWAHDKTALRFKNGISVDYLIDVELFSDVSLCLTPKLPDIKKDFIQFVRFQG